MEKAFIWYPVYRKLPDTNRTVIIQCNLLDEPTIGYFNNATRTWSILDLELSKEEGLDLVVIAWMEMPSKYMGNQALEFRSAAETRYFMSVSASRDVNVYTIDFYKIRNAIYSAAERGLDSCRIQFTDMTEELSEKLKNGGYTIKRNEDCYIVSWT